MSNNPIKDVTTEGLSPDVAAAVALLVSRLEAASDVSTANAAAQSLSAAVTKLRQLGA